MEEAEGSLAELRGNSERVVSAESLHLAFHADIASFS